VLDNLLQLFEILKSNEEDIPEASLCWREMGTSLDLPMPLIVVRRLCDKDEHHRAA